MSNAGKRIENLHSQLPAVFNTKNNPMWLALVDTLGEADQETLDLIETVRKQFFLKTASRPYIDRLGAANLVERPRFVGMEDSDFRNFIPIMSYQPKQVKLALDRLIDLFFFKESTTAFTETNSFEPFAMKDRWELSYRVDGIYEERVEFKQEEFSDISIATAKEIAASINRQATRSYAVVFENNLTKNTSIRLFSNTIGSKGYMEIIGGRANMALNFDGWNFDAGQGVATEYQVTKIGDTATIRYTGNGGSPAIDNVSAGDVIIIDRVGNFGSFLITEVDPVNSSVQYTNLFATPETFSLSSENDVKFFKPFKANIYLKERKAAIWEIRPGEIIAEIPPTPPVVKRRRIGAAHLNGYRSAITNIINRTSFELSDTDEWPDSGYFFLLPRNEIQTKFPTEGDTLVFQYESQLISNQPRYYYSSKSGNTIQDITPELPILASLSEVPLISADRNNNNIITCITADPHPDYKVGDTVAINGATQASGIGIDTNGSWFINEIVDEFTFKCYSFSGPVGLKTSTGGTVRVERAGLAQSGSIAILSTAKIQPGSEGPYLWDVDADFMLSSLTADLQTNIKAGTINKVIDVSINEIPNQEGRLIFDYGTTRQEGPVRYTYKPSNNTIALDPSYIFKFNHSIGSGITMIRRRGGVQFSGTGKEVAPYITDPAVAREVLKELMEELKSTGVFLNFLIRFPEHVYGLLDIYNQNPNQ
jgi:hypothetical protein